MPTVEVPVEFLTMPEEDVQEVIEQLVTMKQSFAVLKANCNDSLAILAEMHSQDVVMDSGARERHRQRQYIFEKMRHNIQMIDGMDLVSQKTLEFFMPEADMEEDEDGNPRAPMFIFG